MNCDNEVFRVFTQYEIHLGGWQMCGDEVPGAGEVPDVGVADVNGMC